MDNRVEVWERYLYTAPSLASSSLSAARPLPGAVRRTPRAQAHPRRSATRSREGSALESWRPPDPTSAVALRRPDAGESGIGEASDRPADYRTICIVEKPVEDGDNSFDRSLLASLHARARAFMRGPVTVETTVIQPHRLHPSHPFSHVDGVGALPHVLPKDHSPDPSPDTGSRKTPPPLCSGGAGPVLTNHSHLPARSLGRRAETQHPGRCRTASPGPPVLLLRCP